MTDFNKQDAIDYGYRFARDFIHGQIVALLKGKIDPELFEKVEEIFK